MGLADIGLISRIVMWALCAAKKFTVPRPMPDAPPGEEVRFGGASEKMGRGDLVERTMRENVPVTMMLLPESLTVVPLREPILEVLLDEAQRSVRLITTFQVS